MKAVILAGGFGTRLSEETAVRPKPMVNIGDQPILWHIMKIYSAYGINDFIVCSGYKGHVIKEFFLNYSARMSDVTFDLGRNRVEIFNNHTEQWRVTIVDTGDETMTGGRIKRAREYLGDETFCLTYGDHVANINISELIEFHNQQDTVVTLTAVQPPGRFGVFNLKPEDDLIHKFREKPSGYGTEAWVNGGFFVVNSEAFEFIAGDSTVWEREPLEQLAQGGKLSAFRHSGFWQPMDTLRDKNVLEELWQSGDAPWKIW